LSRKKLIKQLKEKNPKLHQSELESIINIFTESISNALEKGNNVEIRGLGRWYGKKLKENYNARNPATNELIYKPERVRIRFRASKNLKKIINE
jgi:integration host factor subunit beta|tara:strand:- start:148 stop:429 length:282 start_codon:yes stop_codon:yes gene_type:complete